MNLLESITGAGNGQAVRQLAAQFGLEPEQASAAVAALVPALAAGFQKNMSSEAGLSGLIGALAGGQHEKYLDRPDVLADPATTSDGDAILGHVFGTKDVSRQVAARASEKTGIDTSILKRMLPLIAAMAMGGLSRKSGAGTADPKTAGAGITSMLGPMLDRDGDGSMVDDVAGIVGGFLGGRKQR
jgi:hypothetical protein